MLSDVDIRQAMRVGHIYVSNLEPQLLQPASIDLRLDNKFRVFTDPAPDEVLDPARDSAPYTREISIDKNGLFYLYPGDFVLGSTFEHLSISENYCARVEGKSSLGRIGLVVHSTAGFIDPGFSGNITLEMTNLSNRVMSLYAGMKIGQICFFKLDSPSQQAYGDSAYGSRYQNQSGPTASRGFRNFTKGLPDSPD
jgi:dCTP deaminase